MPYCDQRAAASRCEWGSAAIDALAPADVVVVVDVLSFSTCVDVAVGRGAAIVPYRWKSEAARDFARLNDAELAGPRETSRYSLSPQSFKSARAGLRCVLPSPNGAALSLRASESSAIVLCGCLRNASAVAAAAARLGSTVNVCPAGERWPDGSLRWAVEDWLGAGAILRALPGPRSPEAQAAVAAFEALYQDLVAAVAASSSGRELTERGFAQDIEWAAALDVSRHVPRLVDGTFRDDA
jgi:2-phosphosulfolactate phosphatase